MARHTIDIPAVSPEIEFIARHTADADAICDGLISVRPREKELTKKVYDKADHDLFELMTKLQEEICLSLKGVLRVAWVKKRKSPYFWEHEGQLFMPRGPMTKPVGYVGITFGSGALQMKLIGWVYPKGGIAGRKELTRFCDRKIIPPVRLVSEHADQYPQWDDAVVWFERELTLETSYEDLRKEIAKSAGRFFRIARPILEKYANP
jgi:hypothetical protein